MHAATPARQYLDKTCSASAALDHVRDGDMIIVPTGVGEPPALLTALSDQRQRFHDVKVAQILALRKFGYFDQASAHHVRHASLFFGGASRASGQGGWCDFIPNYFSELPTLIERGLLPADVVFAMASSMNEQGYFAITWARTTRWRQLPGRGPWYWKSIRMCRLRTASAMSTSIR